MAFDTTQAVNFIVEGGILLFGAFVFLGLAGMASWWYFFNHKPYRQIRVTVFQKDNFGNVITTKDWAGIFTKGDNKRLWLKAGKVSLPADNIPYVPILGSKTKELFLHKKGHKNYVFVNPFLDDESLEFNVGEEDVNWALISYKQAMTKFQNNIWVTLAPYGIVLVAIFVTFAIFFMLIKKFDTLLAIAETLKGGFQSAII